jgi:hypothetical protein
MTAANIGNYSKNRDNNQHPENICPKTFRGR